MKIINNNNNEDRTVLGGKIGLCPDWDYIL